MRYPIVMHEAALTHEVVAWAGERPRYREEAVTLRPRGDDVVVLDGPFAETKELVVGYFVVACDSPEQALEVGRELLVGLDAVEIRPVWPV